MTIGVVVSIMVTVGTADLRPQLAVAVLAKALDQAWTLPDPRESVAEVLRVAVAIDPAWAVTRVGAASERIEKLALPPKRRGIQLYLAAVAAPHDQKVRDGILRRAIAEGKRAIADADLWNPETFPPDGYSVDPPAKRAGIHRELLVSQVQAWECVLRFVTDKPAGLRDLTRLLIDTKDKGLGSCTNPTIAYLTGLDLSELDAEIYIACLPALVGKEFAAQTCGRRAYDRWLDRKRDSITLAMANYAWQNGAGDGVVSEVVAKLDPALVAKRALSMPYDPNATASRRGRMLQAAFEPWARSDPVAALEAAEKHPDGVTKRELLSTVAQVWAAQRPAEIERAIKNQDNELRRTWARDGAAAELARRKSGRPAANWQWYIQLPRTTVADAIREAAAVPDPHKRDGVFDLHAENLSRYGHPFHALELLSHIKNPHRAINSACGVARGFMFPDHQK